MCHKQPPSSLSLATACSDEAAHLYHKVGVHMQPSQACDCSKLTPALPTHEHWSGLWVSATRALNTHSHIHKAPKQRPTPCLYLKDAAASANTASVTGTTHRGPQQHSSCPCCGGSLPHANTSTQILQRLPKRLSTTHKPLNNPQATLPSLPTPAPVPSPELC